jgi:hypothetical protein
MEKAIQNYLEQTYDEMFANTSLPNAERERCLKLIGKVYNEILHSTKYYVIEDLDIQSGDNYIADCGYGYTSSLSDARAFDTEQEAKDYILGENEYWDARVVEVVKIGNTLTQL